MPQVNKYTIKDTRLSDTNKIFKILKILSLNILEILGINKYFIPPTLQYLSLASPRALTARTNMSQGLERRRGLLERPCEARRYNEFSWDWGEGNPSETTVEVISPPQVS